MFCHISLPANFQECGIFHCKNENLLFVLCRNNEVSNTHKSRKHSLAPANINLASQRSHVGTNTYQPTTASSSHLKSTPSRSQSEINIKRTSISDRNKKIQFRSASVILRKKFSFRKRNDTVTTSEKDVHLNASTNVQFGDETKQNITGVVDEIEIISDDPSDTPPASMRYGSNINIINTQQQQPKQEAANSNPASTVKHAHTHTSNNNGNYNVGTRYNYNSSSNLRLSSNNINSNTDTNPDTINNNEAKKQECKSCMREPLLSGMPVPLSFHRPCECEYANKKFEETSHQLWIYKLADKTGNETKLIAIQFCQDPFDCTVMKPLFFNDNSYNYNYSDNKKSGMFNYNRKICTVLFYDELRKHFRCFAYFYCQMDDNVTIRVDDLSKHFNAFKYDLGKDSHFVKNIPQYLTTKKQFTNTTRFVGKFINANWVTYDTKVNENEKEKENESESKWSGDDCENKSNDDESQQTEYGLILVFGCFDIVVMKLNSHNCDKRWLKRSMNNCKSSLNVVYTCNLHYYNPKDNQWFAKERKLQCCDIYQCHDFHLSYCPKIIENINQSLFRFAFFDYIKSNRHSRYKLPPTFLNIIDFSWVMHKIAKLDRVDRNKSGDDQRNYKQIRALKRYGFESINFRQYLIITRWISPLENKGYATWSFDENTVEVYNIDPSFGCEFNQMCQHMMAKDFRKYAIMEIENDATNSKSKSSKVNSPGDNIDDDHVFVKTSRFVKFWIATSIEMDYFQIKFNDAGTKLLLIVNGSGQYYCVDCDTMKNLCQSYDTRNDTVMNVLPGKTAFSYKNICTISPWYNNYCLLTLPEIHLDNAYSNISHNKKTFWKMIHTIRIHGCYEVYDIIDTFMNCVDPIKQDYIYNLGFDVFMIIASYVDNFMVYKKFTLTDLIESKENFQNNNNNKLDTIIENAYFTNGWLFSCLSKSLKTENRTRSSDLNPKNNKSLQLYCYNIQDYWNRHTRIPNKLKFRNCKGRETRVGFKDLTKKFKGTQYESSYIK